MPAGSPVRSAADLMRVRAAIGPKASWWSILRRMPAGAKGGGVQVAPEACVLSARITGRENGREFHFSRRNELGGVIRLRSKKNGGDGHVVLLDPLLGLVSITRDE
jgi:hypothetical protein